MSVVTTQDILAAMPGWDYVLNSPSYPTPEALREVAARAGLSVSETAKRIGELAGKDDLRGEFRDALTYQPGPRLWNALATAILSTAISDA